MHWYFIMDGNRRWAKKHNKSLFEAYGQGLKCMLNIISNANRWHMTELSFWALSNQNIHARSISEIDTIFNLFLNSDINSKQLKREIIIRFIGELGVLPQEVQNKAQEIMISFPPKENTFPVNILFNYGAQYELACALGKTNSRSFDVLKSFCHSFPMSDIDITVRTGGHQRLSDGLSIFRGASSDIYFSPRLWPEFSIKDINKIHHHYQKNHLANKGA